MSPLFLALLLPLAAQQQPTGALLDGVAAQAGEALITLKEFERVYKRIEAQQPPRTREEAQRMQAKVLFDLLSIRLAEQKGADLGLDPQQINRITRLNLRQDRERAGLETYLASLEEQGKDALGDEQDSERRLLRSLWEYGAAQGNAYAGRRATRDGGVRPGELREFYIENRRELAPVTVQLRWLIVASASVGGPEAARASCEDARARALAGEDLALLIEERGADFRDTRGLTPFIPPRGLRDPAMAAFAEKAEIGALSEVLAVLDPKTGLAAPELGYQVAQLHDRQDPPIPEFESQEVQRLLHEVFTDRRNESILQFKRAELRREAYVWVNPLLAGKPPPAAPARP